VRKGKEEGRRGEDEIKTPRSNKHGARPL